MLPVPTAHLLALLSLDGVGPATALKLGDAHPSNLSDDAWGKAERSAQETLERCAALDVAVIGFHDAAFPEALRRIPAPPAALYVRGNVQALHAVGAVAVVGTRDPSVFGASATEAFTQAFSQAGRTIVSGLALGVDGIAHRTALKCCALTVAAVACGLDIVHPQSHTRLAQEIVDQGGALISEQQLGTTVTPGLLIARNRLQSGLATDVCVMQSDVRGGTMHTAKFALAQGRRVLCPRPAGRHPKNAGLHCLLSTDIADLPDVCPAFAQARKLCRHNAGRVLATAVGREDLAAIAAGH